MRSFTLISLALFTWPFLVTAQSNNAGFVQGLWYDQTQVFAGEPVRIYVAVRNHSGAELSGTVGFYVDDELLASKSVTAPNERIVESWAVWQPGYGNHTIRAELSHVELSTVSGRSTSTFATATLSEDTIFVDYDTDHDNIGNIDDPDDDGDGVTDIVEKSRGTDPLTPDEKPQPKPTVEGIATSTNAGLEQFIAPSRASEVLSQVTDWTRETKEKLDDYRAERELRTAVKSNDSELPVDESGFGEIIRSTEQSSVAKKPAGFFGDLFTIIENIVRAVITVMLTILSWILSYPALVQILLLLSILILIYKVARHFGRRNG